MLLDRGDVDGAKKMVVVIPSVRAAQPDVLWLTARLAVARGEAVPAREALVRLLDDPHLNGEQRAEALLLLGVVLGDLGDNAAAFATACDGERIQRDLYAIEATSREGEVAKLERLGDWIDAEQATA